MSLYVGVDSGTQSVKAIALDVETGCDPTIPPRHPVAGTRGAQGPRTYAGIVLRAHSNSISMNPSRKAPKTICTPRAIAVTEGIVMRMISPGTSAPKDT